MLTWIRRLSALLENPAAAAWLLIALGVIVYANCLPNAMFWDDDDFILRNAYIQDWRHWPQFFTENIIAGRHLISNYWRPLLQMVFAVEWHLWADWVYGWHAVSVAFQIADSILLFRLILLLFNSAPLALLTAAVFLIHPASNEAVVYANSLGDGLANFFVFGGLSFFARFRHSGIAAPKSVNYWLAWAAFPLALMSKETGILLVAYLGLCDHLLQPAEYSFLRKIRASLITIWPFILTAAIYMVLRATVLNFSNSFNFYNESTPFTAHPELRLLTFFQVLGTYAGLLFIPYDLHVERMIQAPTAWAIPQVIAGAAFMATLVISAWRCYRTAPAVTFGIAWFFAGILPTSNLFVIINAVLYEHFLYTALIGIWIAAFWSALRWASTDRKKTWLALVLMLIFTAYSIRVIWRNTDWRTAIRFYEQLVPRAPKSYRVINNLGMAYADARLMSKAEAAYRQAIALDATNAVAYHNLGNLYRDTNRPDQAIAHYTKAITLQNNFIFSYLPLANLYIQRGDLTRARATLEVFFGLTDEKTYILNTLITLARAQNDAAGVKRYTDALQKLP
jgi:tetratricopeptide (TPR) repeat protein